MAEIYLAKLIGAAGVEKTLALKRIHSQLAVDPHFLELFINEGRISTSLSHSNIVSVYDFGKVGEEYYLAMEYVPGRDLGALLRKAEKSLPWGVAVYVGLECLAGLSYLHRRHKVLHGDIAPRNILVSQEGEIKLADFGVARVGAAFSGKLRGTLPYMSPEQARKELTDARSDLCSLGLVLYEMVCGAPAYADPDPAALLSKVRAGERAPLCPANETTPKALLAIIEKSIALQKEDRFATADEMKEALEALLPQARQEQSPCTSAGMSSLLHSYFGEALHSAGEDVPRSAANASRQSKSFHEARRTELSQASTQTNEVVAPKPISSPVLVPPLVISEAPTPPPQPELLSETPLSTPLVAAAQKDPRKGRRQLWLAALFVLAVGGTLSLLHQQRSLPEPTPVLKEDTPATRPTPKVVASAPIQTSLPVAPASAPSQDAVAQTFPATAPTSQTSAPTPNIKNTNAKKVGYLSFNILDSWAYVKIAGQRPRETPLIRVALPVGKHKLKASNDALKIEREYTVIIEEGKTTTKFDTFLK